MPTSNVIKTKMTTIKKTNLNTKSVELFSLTTRTQTDEIKI